MPTVKVIATGKAAHAGNHHADGANAIWALSRFIVKLCAKTAEVRLTRIEGGQTRNTVPDRATLVMTCSNEVLATLDLTTDIDGTTLELER